MFAGLPSFVLFGAYFPAWMLLALLAIVAAILARAVFLVTGLARVLPFQLFVCASDRGLRRALRVVEIV